MLDEAKKALIIELRRQGKSYQQIMQIAKVSPRDILATLKEEELKNGQLTLEKVSKEGSPEGQTSEKLSTRIYKLLLEGKTLLEIALEMNIDEYLVIKHYQEFCRLRQIEDLASLRNRLGDQFDDFIKMGQAMIDRKIEGETMTQAVICIRNIKNSQAALATVLEATEKAKAELAQEASKLEDMKNEIEAAERNLAYYSQQVKHLTRKASGLEDRCQSLEENKRVLDGHVKMLETSESLVVARAADLLASMFRSHYPIVEATCWAHVRTFRENPRSTFILMDSKNASLVSGRSLSGHDARIVTERHVKELATKTYYKMMEDAIQYAIDNPTYHLAG